MFDPNFEKLNEIRTLTATSRAEIETSLFNLWYLYLLKSAYN